MTIKRYFNFVIVLVCAPLGNWGEKELLVQIKSLLEGAQGVKYTS